jgi:uncharacterized protein DUF1579
MKPCLSIASFAAVAATFLLSAYALQATGQDSKPKDAAAHPAMVAAKPGPEHAVLGKLVGTWDVTVKDLTDPSAPKITKGTETDRMIGGLWLVSDVNGEYQGKPFLGHQVVGYDQDQKQYVSVWVDNMSSTATTGEGNYDPTANKLTIKGTCTKMGHPIEHTSVLEFKDADTLVCHMSMAGADGKDTEVMTLEYKRRK